MNVVDLPLLTAWKATETGTVSVDPYVPLAFEAARGVAGTRVMLLRDNEGETLVELILDDSSGRLRGATIVNLARTLEPEDENLWRLPRTYGVPVLAAAGFDETTLVPRTELCVRIRVALGATAVMAMFGTERADKLLCVERARFLFSRERLIGFGAEQLSADEIGMISGE